MRKDKKNKQNVQREARENKQNRAVSDAFDIGGQNWLSSDGQQAQNESAYETENKNQNERTE